MTSLFLLWCILASAILVQAQPGFISIDCGIAPNTTYTDELGLEYVSDEKYIDTGENHNISNVYQSDGNVVRQDLNLRSFPNGPINCYTLPVKYGEKYMIKAGFFYGNYDGKNSMPRFNLFIGPNPWDSVKFRHANGSYGTETMIVAWADSISVCLVSSGEGAPFISSLRLRPLTKLYPVLNESNYFLEASQYDIGYSAPHAIRYPYDPYDRMWMPDDRLNPHTWIPQNTSSNISSSEGDGFGVPQIIMGSFATPSDGSNINIYWQMNKENDNSTEQQYIILHFAEIQLLASNESRIFDIFLNDELQHPNFAPPYLQTDHVIITIDLTLQGKNNLRISKTENSTLPPILNAFEVYKVKRLEKLPTDYGDVKAIQDVKTTYQIKKWVADPCSQGTSPWEGLNCSNGSSMPPRITYIDLAGTGLSGGIAPSFAELGALQYLNLSGNKLSGQIPEALGQLPSLQTLDLSNNQLQGTIPLNLQERLANRSLNLRTEGNPELCTESKSCKKQLKVRAIAIAVSVVIATSFLVIMAAYVWKLKRSNKAGSLGPKEACSRGFLKDKIELLQLKGQQFTFEDLVVITNNFQHAIGKGGFGTVYRGMLQDGTLVAVKVNSRSSSQGIHEFQAEAELLARIHHKNLVSFVGYCKDENSLALLYEYMAQGSLQEHLRGETSSSRTLQWRERLQIAIEAAQGLEYLHSGCKPPTIHRDVKPSNILLNYKGEAKISDFGVSRIFQNDQTHVSTAVVGTIGYLDPEYFFSGKLTEKSDVYSFGIVILQLITGLPAVLKNPDRGLAHWLSPILASGDISTTVDDRMQGEHKIESVCKAAEIAMKCTQLTSAERPTMTEVVIQLKDCLALELSPQSTRIKCRTEIDTNYRDSLEPSSSGTTTSHHQDSDSIELCSTGMITTSSYHNEIIVSPSASLLHCKDKGLSGTSSNERDTTYKSSDTF